MLPKPKSLYNHNFLSRQITLPIDDLIYIHHLDPTLHALCNIGAEVSAGTLL